MLRYFWRTTLVPVLIEKVRIPLAFRRIHAADFTAWNGKDTEPSFQALVEDLTALLGPTAKKKRSRRSALGSNFETGSF